MLTKRWERKGQERKPSGLGRRGTNKWARQAKRYVHLVESGDDRSTEVYNLAQQMGRNPAVDVTVAARELERELGLSGVEGPA